MILEILLILYVITTVISLSILPRNAYKDGIILGYGKIKALLCGGGFILVSFIPYVAATCMLIEVIQYWIDTDPTSSENIENMVSPELVPPPQKIIKKSESINKPIENPINNRFEIMDL